MSGGAGGAGKCVVRTVKNSNPTVVWAWDPANTSSVGTLSNGNRTYISAGIGVPDNGTRGTVSHGSGKYYFEVVATSAGANHYVGIANESWLVNDVAKPLGTANSWVTISNNTSSLFRANGSNSGNGTQFVTGQVVGVAVDITVGKVWFSVNNIWLSGNPVDGTSPAFTIPAGVAYWPAMSGANGRIGTVPTTLTYAPPWGFSAW